MDDGGAKLFHPGQWQWHQRLQANANAYRLYRLGVAVAGFLIVTAGLIMVPLPGPGWLVVFIGVALWASEFTWAHRLHQWGWAKVRAWTIWIGAQSLAIRGAVALGTCLIVWAALWISAWSTGIADRLPQPIGDFMHTYLFL
ncbi:Putative transmembrane protein (PGPGW) [Dermatophilus congolensis]|uniref:Transmembrane protein (PGPGW) n=1 Tax=Dermatophilus congolensis TaxID=1863 RepID=A0AA46BMX2_9MICO|nr:TIGR02611 family protein [Dermatophilus congolensis]STD08319.1 Putative transmembrane protein (PGPGW) [Dermatophilus congolensis]